MADRSERLAIIVTAQDLASGKLGKVRSELAAMGTAGRISAVGLGVGIAALTKGENALKHFGARVSSLAGPLGLVGLTTAGFGLAGAFERGISKATDWGLAIEKLGGLTSNTSEQLSGLLGITEKYGISNERIAQIVGFTEKTLGKLGAATAKSSKDGAALTKAQDAVTTAHERLRVATLRLQEVEAKGSASASSLAAARFRVRDATRLLAEAEAKLAGIRSSLGADALANAVDGSTKLAALEKTYGVTLTDNKGKVLDFQSVLLNVADAYSKAATAADKAKVAALSAAVFGRGYADLIPILKLGRQGILDAEQAAADLGLTLSTKNVADLAKYREALREAGDATGGLELQLGLLVMPDLTADLKTFTDFLRTHQVDVQKFFADGLHVAEGVAAFVTGTLVPDIQNVASVLTAGWNAIPAPLRDMMAQGVIADRTIKFLFGFSPIHTIVDLAESGLKSVLGGLIGKGIVQPVFVTNQIGLPGALPGAAAGIGVATIASAAVIAASVITPILVAKIQSDQNSAIAGGIGASVQGQIAGGASIADLQKSLAALNTGINDLSNAWGAGLVAGDSLTQLVNQRDAVQSALLSATTDSRSENAATARTLAAQYEHDKSWDSRSETAIARLGSSVTAAIKASVSAETAEFRGIRSALLHAQTPAQIRAATEAAADFVIRRGLGGVSGATTTLSDLRTALAHTHDPTTEAVLRKAIDKVERKLVYREYLQRQIDKANAILHSTESSKAKLDDLRTLERGLRADGHIQAAREIAKLIAINNSVRNLPAAIASGINAVRGSGGSTAPGAGHTSSNYHQADGGVAYPGRIYRVNERREEWFEPIVPTRIHSNAPGLMSAGAARAVLVNLQLKLQISPKVTLSPRDVQAKTTYQTVVARGIA
jgi:hypothetical protein